MVRLLKTSSHKIFVSHRRKLYGLYLGCVCVAMETSLCSYCNTAKESHRFVTAFDELLLQ